MSTAPRTRTIRLYHWTQAVTFLLASEVFEFGETAHRAAGYSLLALVGVRVLWGIAGARTADAQEDRLRAYLHSPRAILHELLALLRRQSRSHLALGQSMALLLMLLMSATAISGYLQTTDRFWGEQWMMDLHGNLSFALTGLVLMHVATQLLLAWRKPDSPLKRMLWQRKRRQA
mgnify:CR=1 FL=1